MRDKAIAVVDVTWLVGLIVFAFTWSTVALVGTGVLFALALVIGWRDRKELRSCASWRYWTEPRVDQAEHWSTTYWGTVALGLLLLGVLGYAKDSPEDGSLPGNLFMGLALMAALGWWRVSRTNSVAVPPTGRDRR